LAAGNNAATTPYGGAIESRPRATALGAEEDVATPSGVNSGSSQRATASRAGTPARRSSARAGDSFRQTVSEAIARCAQVTAAALASSTSAIATGPPRTIGTIVCCGQHCRRERMGTGQTSPQRERRITRLMAFGGANGPVLRSALVSWRADRTASHPERRSNRLIAFGCAEPASITLRACERLRTDQTAPQPERRTPNRLRSFGCAYGWALRLG